MNAALEDLRTAVKRHIEEHGVSGLPTFLKRCLEEWRDTEIKIAIAGDSGAGKSSFINAVRGLKDDGFTADAAKTGLVQTTYEPTAYCHPSNNRIQFWDLPGIGALDYPTADIFCDHVKFTEYDAFLILTAKRFTEIHRRLARKVKSLEKPLFIVRTHIDVDIQNESKKVDFNEDRTLSAIRQYCLKNIRGSMIPNEDLFLISNNHPYKWDFDRLTQAIQNVLSHCQRKSLIRSLNVLTKDTLRDKAELLRARIWKVAAASGVVAIIPIPGLSIAVDLSLLTKEVGLYKSQLGLPGKNSDDFILLSQDLKLKIGKYLIISTVEIAKLFAAYAAKSSLEESARFIPIIGSVIAGSISFTTTYYFLCESLNEMEEIALEIVDYTQENLPDSDINRI